MEIDGHAPSRTLASQILLVKIANLQTEQAVDDYLLFAGCLQEKEYL